MSLLFSVHDLLRTKQPESSQSQKPHKPLPTPPDNPKIRHTSASYKQEWMGQCFIAWQDPKKHLERLLKHRMPASWPGDSALAGLDILGPRRYRWTWPDALWDTFHIQNWIKGLPRWLSGKESACQAGDAGSIPGSGRSPGEGNGKRLQYSCLENPLDRSLKGCSTHMGRKRVRCEWATKQQRLKSRGKDPEEAEALFSGPFCYAASYFNHKQLPSQEDWVCVCVRSVLSDSLWPCGL